MIPLLDLKANWAKVKAGMGSGNMWKTIGKKPTHPYTNGRDPLTEQAQLTVGQMPSNAFTGQTYNNRKGSK
jgi:hypothetical protein